MAFSCRLFLLLSLLPLVFAGYRVLSVHQKNKDQDNCHGLDLAIALQVVDKNNEFGPDIEHLLITVSYETKSRIHLHITDAEASRWEIPFELLPRNISGGSSVTSRKLQLVYTVNPFSFTITRVSDGEVIFDSPASSNFIFTDQYLEITTRIPRGAALFGLGESTRSKGFRLVPNSTYTLWNADTGADQTDVNLYGSYPFYMDVRTGGRAHGVLLLNSNGMDILYQETKQGSSLTYKIIGGVFDFYFFAGPSPLTVVQQYTEVVGKPAAMPYWSLGFHQCRWGYKNVSQLRKVVAGYKAANLPLEVMWTDIDHMNTFKDFTLDPVNFPPATFRSFINELHANSQRFVLIVDPGIKPDNSYETYNRGKSLDIFIKDSSGKPYLGQVWPGPVHYPDFLNPKTEEFWSNEIAIFHKQLPFDGLWIDMNEASNFCTGSSCSLPPANITCPSPDAFTQCCLICSSSGSEDPPYAINNAGTRRSLAGKTIPPSARHYNNITEYDAHNLYGFSEARVTNNALKKVLGTRPFVLSRSGFSGSGRFTAHWTGDNRANWNNLKYSINGILSSGLAGIPMVGADICGFAGDTNEELCNRWIQLGAFYPFSRNHNDLVSKPQELYLWKSVTRSAKKALGLRYRLLPYLYTLIFEAHTLGSPVARPLFFSFPGDPATIGIDRQFLLGSSVLISPVLAPNSTSVRGYFPRGTWYNLFDYTRVVSTGSYKVLEAPLETINVHVYQGSIIPMQEFALTTEASRRSGVTLLVVFGAGKNASGELYIDDDEVPEMRVARGSSSYITFTGGVAAKSGHFHGSVRGEVLHGEFAKKKGVVVQELVILGEAFGKILSVSVDGRPAGRVRCKGLQTGVAITGLTVPLSKSFLIEFH